MQLIFSYPLCDAEQPINFLSLLIFMYQFEKIFIELPYILFTNLFLSKFSYTSIIVSVD